MKDVGDLGTRWLTEAARAFKHVIHGCNEKCTYCVVPNTRGIEQSRAAEAIRVSNCTCNALEALSGRKGLLRATPVVLYTWLFVGWQGRIADIMVTVPNQCDVQPLHICCDCRGKCWRLGKLAIRR